MLSAVVATLAALATLGDAPRATPGQEPAIGAAIAFLGLDEVPAEYTAAVLAIRAFAAVGTRFVRPDAKRSAVEQVGSTAKEGRRVPVDTDPLSHREWALRTPMPDPYADQGIGPVLMSVVDRIVELGPSACAFRESQGQLLCDAVDSLSALDALCAVRGCRRM